MSTDKGATWSKGTNVSHTLGDARAPSLICGPKGEIYICWIDKLSDTKSPDVMFTSSNDGGKSFMKALPISETRGLGADPVVAADDKGVYVAWSDLSPRTGQPDIFFATTRDGGKTWEKRMDIAPTSGRSTEPAIGAADGGIAVVWRDTTGHESNPDIWIALSTDHGKSFGEPKEFQRLPASRSTPTS